MRRSILGVASLALAAAGCVTFVPQAEPTLPGYSIDYGTGTPAPVSTQATSQPGRATPVPTLAATTTPSAGTTSILLKIGSDAGAVTHELNADPHCSLGAIAPDAWSMTYGNLAAGPSDVSQIQLQVSPDSTGKPTNAIASAYIVVGPIFGGTGYTLSLDRFTDGQHTIEVVDSGTTAQLHVAGRSTESPLGPGGILIDLSVSCPSVDRT